MSLGIPTTRRGPIIAIGCLVAVTLGILLVWRVQASRMERDFREAVRAGRLDGLPVELREKVWTDADLATVRVIRLDQSYGKERALLRLMHTAGENTINERQFSYQGMITDATTGIRHVFGYRRDARGGWQYVSIHLDSIQQHIQQRANQEQIR